MQNGVDWDGLRKLYGMRHSDWFVMCCKARYEAVARYHIEHMAFGAECYYPRVDGRAVFPGYIYSRFTETPNWVMLDSCGIATPRLLMRYSADGEVKQPLWVRNTTVVNLMTRELSGDFIPSAVNDGPSAHLVGHSVRVPCGPFAGQLGKVVAATDGVCKVRVRLFRSRVAYLSLSVNDFAELPLTSDRGSCQRRD